MNFLNIFLTGFALSMDAFAVSVTKGITLKNINSKIAFKIAFSFGFFQGVMPLIGWFLGIRFESYIKSIDHWIAFFLLGFIGLKMIFEALESNKIDFKNEAEKNTYMQSIATIDNKEILVLSIATSIDALAVGVSSVSYTHLFSSIITSGDLLVSNISANTSLPAVLLILPSSITCIK